MRQVLLNVLDNAAKHGGDGKRIVASIGLEDGQIVVALVDDEATLKRFFHEGDRIRLHPENPRMKDIFVTDCRIQGVAVKVIHDLM